MTEIKINIDVLEKNSSELELLLNDTEQFNVDESKRVAMGAGMVTISVVAVAVAVVAGVIGFIQGFKASERKRNKLKSQYQQLIYRQNAIIEEQAKLNEEMEESMAKLKSDKETAEKELEEIKDKLKVYNTYLQRISTLRTNVECAA